MPQKTKTIAAEQERFIFIDPPADPRAIDLTNKQFGKLRAIRPIAGKRNGRTYRRWLCVCACGRQTSVETQQLTSNHSTSCGKCVHHAELQPGDQFGKLVVVKRAGKLGPHASWICKCECGNSTQVHTSALRSRAVRSCGCLHAEQRTRMHAEQVLPQGIAGKYSLFKSYRNAAKWRGFEFSLDQEFFFSLVALPCFYCGAEPFTEARKSQNGGFLYSGVDRVNNAAGYTHENVVPCCRFCNMAKGTRSQEDFLNWSERLYLHSHPT